MYIKLFKKILGAIAAFSFLFCSSVAVTHADHENICALNKENFFNDGCMFEGTFKMSKGGSFKIRSAKKLIEAFDIISQDDKKKLKFDWAGIKDGGTYDYDFSQDDKFVTVCVKPVD